ncbi:MAG: flagellar biosynthetic protein FliO [Pseudolabrys sp.]|nr:flagellar biosynthetic protein FliO [Pseudolabrys sp.]
MPLAARFFIAFVVVLALIALAAWLVRRFGANRLANAARGRQPRLAVIDAASVDGRRRLILIRRDNIEHLLMIGGPTDVVVEQNIVRAAATRDLGAGREQPRVTMPADTAPRAVPLGDAGSWPLQPEPTPIPAPVARSYRTATEEPWVAPEIPARPRTELGTMPLDLNAKLGADLGVPQRQAAPPAPPVREPAPAAEPQASAQNDHNLAEMAQRLEAALRRPGAGELHPPATDPLATTLTAPPAAMPRETRPVRPEPKLEPKFESRPEPRAEKPAPAKSAYDSLEQEMASLLGRPSGKT